MRSTHTRLLPLLAALLLAAPTARAEGPLEELEAAWRRVQAEGRIESRMVRGYLRGLLGPRPAAPDWTPRAHGKGRLERGPGGVPIVHLAGTPEEIGEQHGKLLGREIRALLGTYVTAFVGARDLPAAKARAERLFLASFPPRLRREAEALARAADLPPEDVLFGQCFTDVYRAFGCSTLAMPGPEGPFLARNLDFPDMGFLGRYSVVFVVRPDGGRPFVSVGWPGLVGVLSGQSADLALAVMVVHNAEGARAGVPFQLAFRDALERAGSVDETEALLRRTALTCTNNLMLVDRAGARRVLELHPDGIVARGPDDAGRLVATNHFVTRERREVRLSFESLSSGRRFRAVQRACPAERATTLDDARAALDAASVPVTVQSMLLLPGQDALEVALPARGPATRGDWVRLEGLLSSP